MPAYAKLELGVDEGVLTVLLAGFSIGVAVGAVASEALSRGKVGVRVPPIGALGLALMAVELWLATPARPMGGDGALLDRAAFFHNATGWRIMIDFVLLAAFAGLYVTPLNAVLQDLAPDGSRASYIAASNVIDACFIVASAVIVAVLTGIGLRTDAVLVLVTMTALPMGLAVARYAPETHLGRFVLAIWPREPQ